MKVKKGDIVKIITGKDKGRQGRVVQVLPKEDSVVVEGINLYKKHVTGDGEEKESAIVDIVKPLDVSNVMVVCEACGEPTRVGYKFEGDKKIRICKKCSKPVLSSRQGEKSKDSKDEKAKEENSKKDKKSKKKK